ncbi:hypothetical protein [Treponema sp.]|uniref:hypothetical protein n=1 Tax=Treponema sp. TaxID=166 RepID=UPI0025E5E01E|nr:hypothetical protein [Treponema sp.]MCR5218634.1 hypothetical protein [Treponema sp.]
MTENLEKLKSQVQALIMIYDESDCIRGPKNFDITKVKECYMRMADYIIENKDECQSLKNYLSESDFFKSPASTRFHGNWDCGLAVHTLLVTVQALRFALSLAENYHLSPLAQSGEYCPYTAEDVFLSALCHDFCKTGSYKVEFHNTKDINGNWTKKPVFKVKPEIRSLGHGNESVLIMLKIMPGLIDRRNVIEAVSRHMGFSDLSELEKLNYSNFLKNPLVLLLQLADQSAAAWWDC